MATEVPSMLGEVHAERSVLTLSCTNEDTELLVYMSLSLWPREQQERLSLVHPQVVCSLLKSQLDRGFASLS